MRNELIGASHKLERANEHVEDFKAGLLAFLRDNREQFVFDPKPPFGQKPKLIRSQTDVPASLECAIGDAVHNLRSVLDHIGYAVALKRGVDDPKVLRNAGFPIRETKLLFDNAMKEAEIIALGGAWGRFVRSEEPYHGGKGADLAVVSALDNIDKHREILGTDMLIDTFRHLGDGIMEPVRSDIPSKDGIPLALDASDPNHHTHHRTRIVFATPIAGLDRRENVEDVLVRLGEAVAAVLARADSDATIWVPRRPVTVVQA